MRTALIAVAFVAILSVVSAQTCNGQNVTTNIGFSGNRVCPFGYYPDGQQGKCFTYRQLVNNLLFTPCNIDSDCPFLTCGFPDKKCTWPQTRAQNDTCTVNNNCAAYNNLGGGSVKQGCDKTSMTCRQQTDKFVAGLGDRCNYDDYADTIRCIQPNLACSGAAGNCFALLEVGQVCASPNTIPCRTDAVCTGPFSNNSTCQIKKNIGEACFSFGLSFAQTDCNQAIQPAYCHVVSKTCVVLQTTNQNCTTSNNQDVCASGLRCLLNNTPFLGYRQCLPPLYSNETCNINPTATQNVCAPGLTCIPGTNGFPNRCFAGNVTDACSVTTPEAPGVMQVDSCKPGLLCVQNVCVPRVPAGQNCTLNNRLCQDGTVCYNNTCVVPQTVGQPCDPTSYINPLAKLQCAYQLQCSRSVCITNYSLPLEALCANDIDCDSAYCDNILKRCTRRRTCMSDGDCSGGKCVCNGGLENVGQCILNNCGKTNRAFMDCMNPLLNDRYNAPYYNQAQFLSLYGAQSVLFDSQSSFYKKCEKEHGDFVRCNAMMAKWGAPAVPLGDVITVDISMVSGSSAVSASITVMVAIIMSVFMLL